MEEITEKVTFCELEKRIFRAVCDLGCMILQQILENQDKIIMKNRDSKEYRNKGKKEYNKNNYGRSGI